MTLWPVVEAAAAIVGLGLLICVVVWLGEKHAQATDVFLAMDRMLGIQERETESLLYPTVGREVAGVPLKAPATVGRPEARSIEGKFDERRTS